MLRFIVLVAAVLALGSCNSVVGGGDGGGGGGGKGGWINQSSNSIQNLFAVSFSDTLHGWAVGRFVILHTSDGGVHWELQTPNAARQGIDFLGCASPDARHCWVVGSDGSIQATRDGGISWSLQDFGTPGAALRAVTFVDTLNGWAVGRQSNSTLARVLYTSNGGLHWFEADAGALPELNAVSMPAPYSFRGVVCGRQGAVGYTDDGGRTWKRGTTPTTLELFGVALAPGAGSQSFGVAAGVSGIGVALRTSDAGANWQAGQPLPSSMRVRGAGLSDFVSGWMVGDQSNRAAIARTTDGGVSWLPQSVAWSFGMNAISVVDGNHAWMVGDLGGIFYTRTAGN